MRGSRLGFLPGTGSLSKQLTHQAPYTSAKLLKRANMISAIPARMTSSPLLKTMTAPISLSLWVCIAGSFTLVGAPDCASIDALFGRSIGVDAKTSGFALVLERMLHARGFARDDYQLIEIGGWESRYRALMEEKITATLLTEPFVRNALGAGCHLLARDFEMIPSYQGTCGAASRRWAEQHPDHLVRYIRAYVEATQWCFERAESPLMPRHSRSTQRNRRNRRRTYSGRLNPSEARSLPKAAVNLSGVAAALELRAELGYLARPVPPVEKYVDLSYYRKALSTGA